jgi:ABC-2 type transport system ATP-binding protein
MEIVIECRDITRKFSSRSLFRNKRETMALNGLTFEVPRGIVYGLLGPNGSGKTTTIRILSTLLTPTQGQAKVLGFDCVKQASSIRGRIGLIFGGERGLYGRLTGIDNLKYFAAINRLNQRYAEERISELIDMMGLKEAANRPVEQYSRGMRQRLHIARGLLTDPDVIFMDEPTIGLDPAGARDLRMLIPEMIQRGKTILLTTHYMSEADELCANIGIINKGVIVTTGTPTEIKRKFSKSVVIDIVLRQLTEHMIAALMDITGVEQVKDVIDGPIQKLVVHARPRINLNIEIEALLGRDNIEYLTTREPTLEEAYLSILRS